MLAELGLYALVAVTIAASVVLGVAVNPAAGVIPAVVLIAVIVASYAVRRRR